jgi:hypothetical protein
MSGKGKFRMSIPKSEEDYQNIEKEIRSEASTAGKEIELGLNTLGSSEDILVLLLNTIAHTLGHVEAELNNMNLEINNLVGSIDGTKKYLKTLTKAILYTSVNSAQLKKELLKDLLEELIKE